MAQSADNSLKSRRAGEQDEPSATLDMQKFCTKPSIRPPVLIETWKKEFSLALYAKTMIRVQEVKHYMHEPALEEVQEEQATGVETKMQEEQRLARNKAAKEGAQKRYDMAYKRWKESSASGLKLSAANYRAKAIFYMMLGPEGQRRFQNKMPHVDVEEVSIDFGDLWLMLDVAFHRKRNIIEARVALFSRRQEEGETL